MRRNLFSGILALTALTCAGAWAGDDQSAVSVVGGEAATLPLLQESPSFTLTDHAGRKMDLAETFAGRPVIVYFGYTFCPDVCPTTLWNISSALTELKQEGLPVEKIGFLFVSVDPERDTPEDLAEYVGNFYPTLIGATGTPEEIRRIADSWRVTYSREGGEGEDYTISHTAYAFALDRDHRVVHYLWHFAKREKLIEAIRSLL